MSDFSDQEIAIGNLAREAGAQRARLDDVWRSLRLPRKLAMTTICLGLAVAKGSSVRSAVIDLALGKSRVHRKKSSSLLKRG